MSKPSNTSAPRPAQEDLRRLADAVEEFNEFKVVLLGDFMLDQQIRGDAERLSPEAPVPVLRMSSRNDVTSNPGGASNVAGCLRVLGAQVFCVGVRGADDEGDVLCTALAGSGCNVDGLLVDEERPTTLKQSLIGLAQHRHPQKMFRLDFESRAPLAATMEQQLLDALAPVLDGASVLCIEDYGKGVCSQAVCASAIRMAREQGVRVLVDPAPLKCYKQYDGATLLTPNRTEAELLSGLRPLGEVTLDHGRALTEAVLDRCAAEAVVVTLDRDGAMLQERGGTPQHLPTRPRQVYDVTGAGDVVLAVLACGLANGLSFADSIQLANVAAGLEVETFGVRPIALAELRHAVRREAGLHDGLVRTLEELLVELAAHRAQGKSIVLTNGCFDLMHAGHVAYLRDAKNAGDILVIGVNTDEQVRELKGDDRPIFSLHERLEMLSELRSVDLLVAFAEETAHDLIRAVRPDLYVKGGDYAAESICEFDLLQELGIEVRVLAHRAGLGSTPVIERIRSGG